MRYKKKMNKEQENIIENVLHDLRQMQDIFIQLKLQLEVMEMHLNHVKHIEKPKPKTKKVKNK